ncbi:AAA family ATPase [Nitriliruptoraceae bacterium ZYF776]|nr:AAA family ATPase [Profundirhabdus halotolerans]
MTTTTRVLLAIADADAATTFAEMGRESGDFEVVATAVDSSEVYELLDDEIDVIVVHEHLGPLPTFDLARDLTVRHPDVGLVLLARQPTQDMLDGALRSGFRGIARLPLQLEEIQASVSAASEWTRAVRHRLQPGVEEADETSRGRMIAIAGGKGGVGTTTVAVQLAVLAQRSRRGRRVCLVDLDLQTGDVRSLLDLTHRRSITDLVGVASELSSRQLDESLSSHESGLRVLLPPVEGEFGEDVDALSARQILGGIRSRFDIVIVDVGSVMTEAGSVAVELSDQTIVVTTPDVPAMRGTNRLLTLWDRLQVRSDDIQVLLNRTSRDSEIQSDMVRRIVDGDTIEATIPAGFWSLESPANTGNVTRLADGAVRSGIEDVAQELKLTSGKRRRGLRKKASGEDGSVTVEWLAILPIVIIVTLVLWQAVLWGYTYVLASHSAREAAQVAAVTDGSLSSMQSRLESAARGSIPDGWRGGLQVRTSSGGTLDTVEVTLRVPILFPGMNSPWTASADQGTFREDPSALGVTTSDDAVAAPDTGTGGAS